MSEAHIGLSIVSVAIASMCMLVATAGSMPKRFSDIMRTVSMVLMAGVLASWIAVPLWMMLG